ncbi:hypothetical protein D621_02745 [beta proteobacterium AAP51]|nr:hypothetical protein D621_02745 [beta proteobacterium AAP51]
MSGLSSLDLAFSSLDLLFSFPKLDLLKGLLLLLLRKPFCPKLVGTGVGLDLPLLGRHGGFALCNQGIPVTQGLLTSDEDSARSFEFRLVSSQQLRCDLLTKPIPLESLSCTVQFAFSLAQRFLKLCQNFQIGGRGQSARDERDLARTVTMRPGLGVGLGQGLRCPQ